MVVLTLKDGGKVTMIRSREFRERIGVNLCHVRIYAPSSNVIATRLLGKSLVYILVRQQGSCRQPRKK